MSNYYCLRFFDCRPIHLAYPVNGLTWHTLCGHKRLSPSAFSRFSAWPWPPRWRGHNVSCKHCLRIMEARHIEMECHQ